MYDTDQLVRKLETALGHVQDLVKKVVRDEDGTQFYMHNSGQRHFAKDDEDKIARFLRGPKGEISASTEDVEPYPLGDPMDSVLRCKLLYRDPGPHIYALLNGKTYYPGTNDLDYWGETTRKNGGMFATKNSRHIPAGTEDWICVMSKRLLQRASSALSSNPPSPSSPDSAAPSVKP